MTEYIAHIVQQGQRFRVALSPVSYRGGSPIVAASWAEQDNGIFEASSRAEAEAFIGQMSEQTWTTADSERAEPTAKAKSRR